MLTELPNIACLLFVRYSKTAHNFYLVAFHVTVLCFMVSLLAKRFLQRTIESSDQVKLRKIFSRQSTQNKQMSKALNALCRDVHAEFDANVNFFLQHLVFIDENKDLKDC